MASKAIVYKFDKTNKATIDQPVGHTRTGACTSKGKCFHAKKRSKKR